MKIDITDLLEGCVQQSAEFGIPKDSLKSRLMLEAAEEIKSLREQLTFQIKLADDNNNSRLRLLDVIGNCRDLYEETCKDIRERTIETYVCGMCIEDCDHGPDGYANECSGFEKDDCFRLNVNKFNDIVFKKEGEQE